LLALVGVLVILWMAALSGLGLSIHDLWSGLPSAARVLKEMVPPDTQRLPSLGRALGETARIAFGGVGIGLAMGLLLSPFAARNLGFHPVISTLVRTAIIFIRSIPELVWAVLFVAMVGLGPFAGLLTVVFDTLGYCGKFFADALEDTPPEPSQALYALGAGRFTTWAASLLPQAFPVLMDHALFSVERAVRSSIVLGLVGAGGIGLELKVAMDMLLYREAASIILGVFLLVIIVEQTNHRLRAWLVAGNRSHILQP
jgi:phosphonate transport system permease protein